MCSAMKSIDPRAIFLCFETKPHCNLQFACYKRKKRPAGRRLSRAAIFLFCLNCSSQSEFSQARSIPHCRWAKKISSTRKQRVDAKVLKQALKLRLRLSACQMMRARYANCDCAQLHALLLRIAHIEIYIRRLNSIYSNQNASSPRHKEFADIKKFIGNIFMFEVLEVKISACSWRIEPKLKHHLKHLLQCYNFAAGKKIVGQGLGMQIFTYEQMEFQNSNFWY